MAHSPSLSPMERPVSSSASWRYFSEVPLNWVAPKEKGNGARILAAGQSYKNLCCFATPVITARRGRGSQGCQLMRKPFRRHRKDTGKMQSCSLVLHWMHSKPTQKFERRHKDCLEEGNVSVRIRNAALGLQNKHSSNGD